MIRFHGLGGLAVTDGGEELTIGGPRQRRLLAVLLIHRNAVVSVDRLAEAVFAGEPTAAAATTLRSYIARVRRVVDRPGSPSMVVTQAPGYVLRVPAETFDVAVFERLVSEAGALLSRGDAAGASPVLREALALWQGEAYAEFADEEWALPEAQRLAEMRLVAHERLVEAELACGRAAELIPEIEALAREHPLRETFRAQLMTAYYRAGRQADALRVFGDHRELLLEELGLDPSPALVELERRVLTHDPTLLLDEPAGRPLRGYRLGERLGTGRDGTVFAARLAGVDRDFAIRVFREDIADSPEFIRSFEATVHRVASLRHPAIVPIHDYWREPGAAYLVMRRVHGGTLADRLGRGPLTAAVALAVVRRIGGALTAAADAGIAHGRISPENVLFDADAEPYLGDFAVGPSDSRGRDDVSDFAVLVEACLASGAGSTSAVLAQAIGSDDRRSMADLVAALTTAMTGDDTAGVSGPPNPYKGLRAFDEADAVDFFGRDELVTEILDRLSHDTLRGRLVLVVGGSGTGKSSVVRAGLLPRVRRGDVPGSSQWLLTTMLPGSSPLKELAESLRHVAVGDTSGLVYELAQDGGIDRVVRKLVGENGDLLLVIDQFEELFTLASESDQRAFLRGVMDAVTAPDSRLRVVATLRADFYDRPLAVQPFGSAVRDATVTIPAMLPAELEAAIVEPAERVGGRVERALVAELVSAVVDEPAALPSLQYVLYELAGRSPARQLTVAAYRGAGGIDGAIASRAEALYSTLDDHERGAVRGMFERLVAVSADAEPTRRRAARTELSGTAAGPGVDDVIDRWADARLLTLDRHPQTRVPTVEVAHEALLREWPRLRSWLDEDREALVVLGRLREAASSWAELGRDPGALYRGARLDVALDATNDRFGALPPLEQEFLVASREERDREEREASERVTGQARANRRLRIQLAVIGIALVFALVGGFVAVDQRREAQQERRRATARELAAAADASIEDDPERSMLLALAAIDEARTAGGPVLPEAVEALHRAVTASRIVLTVPGVGSALDWSPDGTLFVTEGPEESGLIDLRDAATGESVRAFDGHDVDINGVRFSADGRLLATTGDDGAARVWNPATGDLLMEYKDRRYRPGSSLRVTGPSFAPDGDLIAASFGDVIRVIDVATGRVARTIPIGAGGSATAFSPDGQRVAFGSFGGAVAQIADVGSGDVVALGDGEGASTWDLAWSPDGRWIATTGEKLLRLWDANTGELRFTGPRHTTEVNGVDWSPEGNRLATVGDDGRAVVYEITDGGFQEVFVLAAKGRSQSLFGVAFSPDGKRLMAGDTAVTAVTVWDVTTSGGAEWLNAPSVPESGVDFTADGRLVRVGRDDAVHVSDAATGEHLRELELRHRAEEFFVGPLEVSDDGSMLAVGMLDRVDAWELETGARRFSHPFVDGVGGLDWSNDGNQVVVAGYFDPEVVVLDRAGDIVSTFHEEPDQRVTSVSISPDGRRVATTREGVERVNPTDMPVTIWDSESGEIVSTIDTSAAMVAFDPTGETIATSRRVETIVDVWDASTGDRVTTMVAAVPITGLGFSSDGKTIASGHADGSVRLWDAASGVQRLSLDGGGGAVNSLAFNADGTKLATNGADGLVRVWALDVDDLVAIATERLTRGFTDDECSQYLHLASCPPA